ncbi:pumilio homolog 15-like [Solanum stenotomum]|uniref:pumilio homolog 15-like n=1 Tax=Solanum stenotomum TaxID=172797 RepID=UPI0020D0C82E|nr:pumilio homolog 15-like [Solanum stenotomum]
MARNPKDSRLLQKILELNNYDHIQKILEVLSSIYEVMIYEYGHALFVKLVEFCNNQQLHLILSTFQFHMDLFLQTAFTKNGSMSIEMLILFALMTHRVERHIVEKCFRVLNEKQNEVLYRVISYFRDLATNVNGCCISLDVCIDHITNPLRKELLERIVNQSAYFAHDPSRNYVVQHILKLGDIEISNKVCLQLEKEYIQLAFKRTGNRVFGKCLESSKVETISVVDVLLTDAKAIARLAKHFYGSYVIRKALQYTKVHGQEVRHQDLVSFKGT